MALFRKPIPRRALIGAIVGFIYGCLWMPTGGTEALLAGIGWVVLSISLLFAIPIAYYTYVTWALLWLAWRAVLAFRGQTSGALFALLDIAFPLASLVLLSSSGYVEALRPLESDE